MVVSGVGKKKNFHTKTHKQHVVLGNNNNVRMLFLPKRKTAKIKKITFSQVMKGGLILGRKAKNMLISVGNEGVLFCA